VHDHDRGEGREQDSREGREGGMHASHTRHRTNNAHVTSSTREEQWGTGPPLHQYNRVAQGHTLHHGGREGTERKEIRREMSQNHGARQPGSISQRTSVRGHDLGREGKERERKRERKRKGR